MSGVAVPGMDCYEDMFKEITRKLYGEEGVENGDTMRMMTDYEGETFKMDDGHGSLAAFGLAALMHNGFAPHTSLLGTQLLQDAEKLEEEEDRWISSEESIPWTQSKIASYNAAQKLFRCNECECVGFLSRVAEHWLGTHANLRVFQCPQCPYASAWARCVRMHLARQHNVCPDQNADSLSTLWKENPVLEEVTNFLQRLKNKVEAEPVVKSEPSDFPQNQTPVEEQSPLELTSSQQSPVDQSIAQQVNHDQPSPQQLITTQHSPPPQPTPPPLPPPPPPAPTLPAQPATKNTQTETSSTAASPKRYNCNYCHYATDRRDLYTRHENIHRDEKPFHCYICQKQFNRADHVKKHFLRMHRDQPYDLNRIRRTLSKNSTAQTPPTYFPKPIEVVPTPVQQSITETIQLHHSLTIPGYPQPQRTEEKKSPRRKPGEKRYSCCYCSWSGVDNWCLKRHLNTHLKPFVCGLCEYKAARSERLATHVFKVHNKRACSRCSFLADDQMQLTVHQQQNHQ